MTNQTTNKTRRRIIRIIIGVVLFFVVAYLGIGAYAISDITTPDPPPTGGKTPGDFGVEYQKVTFPARTDGLKIVAWYLPNESSNKAIIIVHGRNASKQHAASETIVAFETALQKAGYAVLAIDLRGHGESEEARYSFGVYERRDVLGAVDFLKEQGFQSGNIGVVGISLGGAAVNGAVAETEDIGAVVTEGTLGDFEPIIYEQWENESGLPNFFLPGVFLMNRIMFGYSLAEVHPAEEIANATPRPMLVIHCTEDDTVIINQSDILLEAAPHAESWIMSDCEHAELHRDYPEEYCDRVIAFFDENL
jgi:dipeptidyl aminopeptidase/acylaminoacyl peptidase